MNYSRRIRITWILSTPFYEIIELLEELKKTARQPKSKKLKNGVLGFIKEAISEDVSITLNGIKKQTFKRKKCNSFEIHDWQRARWYELQSKASCFCYRDEKCRIKHFKQIHIFEWVFVACWGNGVFLDEMGVNCSMLVNYGRSEEANRQGNLLKQ
jgi:hypothetical protein